MFDLHEYGKKLHRLLSNLQDHGHIDIIDKFESSNESLELKIAIEDKVLDLLIKNLEINLFLPALAGGFSLHRYRSGSITNQPGHSVLELKISK
jgi:hypothetical protein